jgi:MFS superfamily sulfate permease-like transporter
MESKMRRYFWPADHPAAMLALVATIILVFAWPLENVPACVLATVMMVVAAGITIRAQFHSADMG